MEYHLKHVYTYVATAVPGRQSLRHLMAVGKAAAAGFSPLHLIALWQQASNQLLIDGS